MKTKPQHTPTPWHLNQTQIVSKYSVVAITNPNGRSTSSGKVCVDDIANAEYIVKCVNSHEALLDAAKSLLESKNIRNCPHGMWSTADAINYSRVRRLEQAIAQAEGKDL